MQVSQTNPKSSTCYGLQTALNGHVDNIPGQDTAVCQEKVREWIKQVEFKKGISANSQE